MVVRNEVICLACGATLDEIRSGGDDATNLDMLKKASPEVDEPEGQTTAARPSDAELPMLYFYGHHYSALTDRDLRYVRKYVDEELDRRGGPA